MVSVTYLENWNQVFNFAPFDLVGHTWSLATEEQFYWLWPLLLPLVLRSRPLAWLISAAAVMTAVRVFMCSSGPPEHEPVQYFIGSRPVGLLIGCALAFLPAWRLPSSYGFVALAALAPISMGTGAYGGLFVAGPLVASLATAVIIMSVQAPGRLSSTLSVSPLRYIGKISYGLYIYHWPIFFLLGAHLALAAVISFALAALSYQFVEKPFLRLKDRPVRAVAPVVVAAG